MEKLIADLKTQIELTKKDMEMPSADRSFFAGKLDGLQVALTLAEGQEKVEPAEELKEGDQVEVLIDYISVKRGMQGTVRKTKSNWEYPIEVQFPEDSLGYWFDDDRVSFKDFELRKVG